TKIGTGTLTLTGNNTYDGLTTISAGTLVAVSVNALGSIFGGTSVSSGATLDVQAAVGGENLQLAGTGVSGNGALISSTGSGSDNGFVILKAASALGGAGSLTLGGPISGGFSLTKVGSGTTMLAGTNTYSGATVVNGGALLVNGSLAVASTVSVNNGATLGGSRPVNGAVTV